MTTDAPNLFKVGDDEYSFEIVTPPYTKRPMQVLDEQPRRWEDRFHRTVNISRLADARSWTGAADMKSLYMKDLPAYLQRWLSDCFARWDTNAIPEGFEIPQGVPPDHPEPHHCAEFPVIDAAMEQFSEESKMVDTASDESFPASDPPEWTGVTVT